MPRIVNERTTNWTAGPSPNLGWAQRVHPELEPQAALDKLWDEMVYVLRLDSDDPVEAWRERMKTIVASADRMTERRFDALHLQGPGTDLTIGLLPSSKWLGADFKTIDGLTHYPNLPTEEVFTTPDPERVDGHVSATMPLELYGSYMDGIRIEFEGGRAVKIDADEGADALRATAARDDGASRLGEIALVDKEGRIGPLGTVFYETLLDENAASHIALGNAYTFPVEDEADRERVEQERHPRRLHDRLERGRRGRDHPRRRPRAGPPRRLVADLVRIVPYDPAWPAEFEAERALLEPVLAPWLAGEIHHVGSTSVPGLGAKPVIDILAEVSSLEESRAAIEPLRELSYWWFPYQEERMNWFCKPSPEHRTHHLHLVVPGSEAWREELAFRDALRAEPETARAYEELKRRLADEHATRPRGVHGREDRVRRVRARAGALGGLADGDRVQPLADLRGALAQVVEPRQRGGALEPEDAFEERRRPVADGATRAVVASRLGDQAALEQAGDGRVGGDPADAGDLRPAARAEVGDDRERLQGRLREASLDRPLEEAAAGLGGLARGAEGVAAGDVLQHDPAAPLAVPIGEQPERELDPLDVVRGRVGELFDRERRRGHDEQGLERPGELVDRVRGDQAERTIHSAPPFDVWDEKP